jgi:hypothetical protein
VPEPVPSPAQPPPEPAREEPARAQQVTAEFGPESGAAQDEPRPPGPEESFGAVAGASAARGGAAGGGEFGP